MWQLQQQLLHQVKLNFDEKKISRFQSPIIDQLLGVTTTTTRCPEDDCKEGERETPPGTPTVTPSPPDYCQTGEEDIERPTVTTPLPC